MVTEALEQRVSALERRVDNHADRISVLEQRSAATEATAKAMQQDIAEAKEAAKAAAEGVNKLVFWAMTAALGWLGTLVIGILLWVVKQE